MRLPRDLDGSELASALRNLGYHISRQTGSHIRLTSSVKGAEHHVTIPRHSPLKVGTLSAILGDISSYLDIEKEEVVKKLFH